MESVLRGHTYKACLAYLDDAIVLGQTFQEQHDNLWKLFQMFQVAHVELNPKKCQLFQEAQYLAQIMLPEGVTMDPEKLKAVLKWPPSKDKYELSFLGLCTYYQRLMPGIMDITKPLTQLMEEKQTFQWSLEGEAAFWSMKELLCMAPSLGYP